MGDVAEGPERMSLDGDGWLFRSFLGDGWQAARLGEPAEAGRRGWLPARVPGTVVADLLAAGEIPDPYLDRNSRFAEWAADRWWAYRRDLDVPAASEGERLELVLEGVDYAGRVYLDGELVGEHEGMFVPARFEVGEWLRGGGTHSLAVLIAPAPGEEPQTGDTGRVRTHKTRMSYGWDFCPRLVQQGIWQPVWLRRTGPVRIERPFVRPRLSDDHRSAVLEVELALDTLSAGRAHLDVAVGLAGDAVARESREVDVSTGGSAVRLEIAVDQPALWWPNGYGHQPLYEVELTVGLDGRVSDRETVRTGIRSLRLMPNEGAPPGARPYRFVVNGVSVYANGWNWVPVDMLYGVSRPQRLRHLLGLARRAHVTLLRVWGGGLIESEAFYAECDRLGILVWQEFIQSSSGVRNEPAADPAFVAMMAAQAEQIVPRRRNHPSLALWCGGNELMRDGRPLDESAPPLGALRDVVARLDPDRPFLPTSPSGPVALLHELDDGAVGHDVHGPWEHQGLNRHQALYGERASLLHSEFGVEGMASAATLEATISPGSRWPPTRDNPAYAHRGAWWINEALLKEIFGDGLDDLASLVRASQFLQADGLRYAVEASLCRRWLSSGTLPWQFNEPFPNAWCTSAVEHSGRPKPAYHAVAAAYEPVHACASFARQAWAGEGAFDAQLWATSTDRQAVVGTLVTRVIAADGREAARVDLPVECPPLAAARVGDLSLPLARIPTDLFLLDLALMAADGVAVSVNRYLHSRTADLAPMRALPRVELELARADRGADTWEVSLRNRGDVVAPALRIEDGRPVDAPGWVMPSTDLISLLPAEERTLAVDFADVPDADRRLLISGWNVEERVLG